MINLNEAFEDEIYFKYLRDPDSVSPEWRKYFEKTHGKSIAPIKKRERESGRIYNQPREEEITNLGIPAYHKVKSKDELELEPYESLEPLSSIQVELAKNLEKSLAIPSASSSRTIPVKALDENRRIINRYQKNLKRKRVSFTHILAWAIVKSLIRFPHLNDSYVEIDGKPHRIVRNNLNVGLAIDITKNDGTRLLLVPNVKNAQDMDFGEFVSVFQKLIDKAKRFELQPEDLEGTSVTLANPGMIGTSYSMPRLLTGQGAIISTGSIDYPPEFQAVRPEVMANFAVSKVVTITNTYDHRIIQGAESAEFLAYLNKLLIGEERFYDQIFYSLNIPFEPIRWSSDHSVHDSWEIKTEDKVEKGAHVMQMLNAYRVRGHLLASVNPLGFDVYYYPELDPAYYGFTIWDLDRFFHADDTWQRNNLPLRDIIELLRETYCGSTGFEFMHIQSPEKKTWIKEKLERTRNKAFLSNNEKIHTLKKIIDAEAFEEFIHTKYIGHKRFSLEGAETTIVTLDKIFEKSADSSLHSIVLGMSHRGRLNVLLNNVGKSLNHIFKEFDDDFDPKSYKGSGDVKYHLGDKGYYISPNNNTVSVILSPNPSHLELVDPVINGMSRALDNEIEDDSYSKVLPIIVHGDAAFAGQGIVAETLNLSQLEGYSTGGTIHLIINNQIGFTTTTDYARSTIYATDIAKMLQIPILHVNGNDPEAVRNAATFACEYREQFGSDVIIDLLCYRKYGHNEADEPSFTQPLLYKKIKSMKKVSNIYTNQLIKENVINEKDAENFVNEAKNKLEKAFESRKEKSVTNQFNDISKDITILRSLNTKVKKEKLDIIIKALTAIPENFNVNPKVMAGLKKRRKVYDADKPAIDWSLAEALAMGTILLEGNEIRFSGQDSRRGTFSQRHSVLIDMVNEEEYYPLNNISSNQAKLRIFDSPLSEIACLGFEYGYSVIAENSMTVWEAQFGDFANNAQSVVDQFISCGEMKWGQTSSLIMLLPHSYDGQGPEHSSARLERYLQLCANDNMIVGNFTTPAQYFHALRRHNLMPFKVPMMLMTPKSMLRHPEAVSSVDELARGKFQNIIDDNTIKDRNKVKKIIITTGKIYYELKERREEKGEDESIALIRLEQIYPFDDQQMSNILKKYENAEKVIWTQEEPKNMGAWSFVFPRLTELMPDGKKLRYVGRVASSSTATGSNKIHNTEQNELLEQAMII